MVKTCVNKTVPEEYLIRDSFFAFLKIILHYGLMQIHWFFIVRPCPRAETHSQAYTLSLYINKKEMHLTNFKSIANEMSIRQKKTDCNFCSCSQIFELTYIMHENLFFSTYIQFFQVLS